MPDNTALTRQIICSSLLRTKAVIDAMYAQESIHTAIQEAVARVYPCLKQGGKLLFAGNGGSAADAQHMAAEYVSRFMFDRPGLAAVALTTDTSALTAIGNDYGFDQIFARQIAAIGRADDVLFAYSTSGASPNILAALDVAKRQRLCVIGMTGAKANNPMIDQCDICIRIPSEETPHIQEGHLVVGHLICLAVEQLIFGAKDLK